MKLYFFTMTQCSFRTGASLGKTVGVIYATTQDEAEDKAWKKYGNDGACSFEVWEVAGESESFTVFYNS